MSIFGKSSTTILPNPDLSEKAEVPTSTERLRQVLEEARSLPEATTIAAQVVELVYERVAESLGMLAEAACHLPPDRDLGAAQEGLGSASRRLTRFYDRNRPLLALDEEGGQP